MLFWKQALELGGFLRSRVFAVSLWLVTVAGIVFYISCQAQAVYFVNSNAERSVHYTTKKNSASILKPLELSEAQTNEAEDSRNAYRSSRDPSTQVENYFVEITAPMVVTTTLTLGESVTKHKVEGGTTVGELLEQQGVPFDGNDIINHSPEKIIEHGDKIVVQCVEYEKFVETQTIPYTTIQKTSPLIREGVVKVAQEGKAGVKTVTYVEYSVDGEAKEVQMVGEQVTSRPVNETILIGASSYISPLDFDVEIDERGKPVKYKRVFTNQVATGYSARPGALTASGRKAVVGHVAVNPNEIPYGSKLFITTADGSFVYGYAVAADTGVGLLQGVVDVDLFYDTYAESALNGRRTMDVYVLE